MNFRSANCGCNLDTPRILEVAAICPDNTLLQRHHHLTNAIHELFELGILTKFYCNAGVELENSSILSNTIKPTKKMDETITLSFKSGDSPKQVFSKDNGVDDYVIHWCVESSGPGTLEIGNERVGPGKTYLATRGKVEVAIVSADDVEKFEMKPLFAFR